LAHEHEPLHEIKEVEVIEKKGAIDEEANRGFLMAAYKNITENQHHVKFIRLLLTSLVALVAIILSSLFLAFIIRPKNTAQFFKLRVYAYIRKANRDPETVYREVVSHFHLPHINTNMNVGELTAQ
jgi:hypothetical protein